MVTRQTTAAGSASPTSTGDPSSSPTKNRPLPPFVHQLPKTGTNSRWTLWASNRRLRPGALIESESRLFAGAKVVTLIDHYEAKYGIEKFYLSIDWGWFRFLPLPGCFIS